MNNLSLKSFFDGLDVTRRGYVVNKRLTRGFFFFLLWYGLLLVVFSGPSVLFGGLFMECPVDALGPCHNPFYDSSCLITGDFCESEFVSPGWSFGVRPSFFVRLFPVVAFGGFFLVLFLNHRLYNKGWRLVKLE